MYWSEDQGRIGMRIEPKTFTLTEHVQGERAPLVASGTYESTMEHDGSFTVGMAVKNLGKELLSRCLGCKDIHEPLTQATFDGQPMEHNGAVRLKITFSEGDRIAEMCFIASGKCLRLKQN
jgi:hypothetical protein